MEEASKPKSLMNGDPRLAVVAMLIGINGEIFGIATALTSDIAVTTAEVVDLARAKVDEVKGDHSSSAGPLMLFFPQFVASLGVGTAPATIQTVDKERGFAVVHFAGMPLPPVYDTFLATGDPSDGAECEVLYFDASQNPVEISGWVGGRIGLGFRLDLGSGAPVSILGAPVFKGGQLVGIVASVRRDASDPSEAGSGFVLQHSIEVLSIDAMARSEVTPVVRNLLHPIAVDSNPPTPFPTVMEITQTDRHEGEIARSSKAKVSKPIPVVNVSATDHSATLTLVPSWEGKPVTVEFSDSELFARLSLSSRRALGRAVGIRRATGQGAIHMEHLIAGLFDEGWRPFFEEAGIGAEELRGLIMRTVGTELPRDYRPVELGKLPAMSKHVKQALAVAANLFAPLGGVQVRSKQLLHGALSVEDCRFVQALIESGVRRELIPSFVGPDSGDEDDREVHAPILPLEPEFSGSTDPSTPTEGGANPGANPTPKVDSDRWCRTDCLGYEAYARTIADLITHKETVAPLTIGIKAPWGAGKTSLMKRVQHLLDGYAELSEGSRTGILQDWLPQLTLRELMQALKGGSSLTKLQQKESAEGKAYGLPHRTTVWFNAWKYQTSEQIWAGMAHCIISQLTARMDAKDRELFWLRLHARRVNADEVRKKIYEAVFKYVLPYLLLFAIASLLLLVVPVAWYYKFAGMVLSLFPAALGAWRKYRDKAAGTVRQLIREPEYEGKMGFLHLVESDMREVLQLATAASITKDNPNGDPLVVFVDDLDRCAPNKVAEVVEAINLFLCGDYPDCIFVLGMEPGMVAAALQVANKDVIDKAEEMGVTDQTVPVGWRFMEKIVQLPIMIPPPTKGGKDSYVESLTGMREYGESMAQMMEKTQPAATQVGAMTADSVALSKKMAEVIRPRAGIPEPLEEKEVLRYMGELEGRSLMEVEEKSAKVLAAASADKRRAAAEASKRIYARTFSDRDPLMGKFVREVADLVDGNPRQIKRYVNVFRFYSTLRHSLRVDGVVAPEELPTDETLAKFVALSIHWPHAMDCLRKKDAKASEAKGRRVTLLELLELESRKTPEDVAAVDAEWEKLVEGLNLGVWANRAAFREFLARGESLCAKEGHGLW
jgi:hypothetical protein